MQQVKHIEEYILSTVGNGEILIIIPPFGSIYDVALGPHILQALAREKGYKIDILYLNMLLASIIGVDLYEAIYYAPETWMLGERLFARSAYGLPPLGKYPERCTDEVMFSTNSKIDPKMFAITQPNFDPVHYLPTEQICKSFIDEVISLITSMNYNVIGCTSSMMRQTNCSVAILKGVKKHSPRTITIIGGSSCKNELAKGIASLSVFIDYIFSGESETAFLHFLEGYSAQKFSSRRIITGEPLNDLDCLPLVDYDVFLGQYTRFLGEDTAGKTNIWYETSRGCWWAQKSQCVFCSEHNRISYRQKSIDKVVSDLGKISRIYPDQLLSMTDIIMPQSYHRELFPVISKKEGFPTLGYQLRADLDLEELINLKKAKVKAILPGLETFSTHLLKLMNKGITGYQSLLFLRNANSVGLYVDWVLLWGFPGDRISDYEEILHLLPLIRHLQPPRKLAHMVLMRFSPYLKNHYKYKISDIHPWGVLEHVYPDWADLEKLAVYYTGKYACESHNNPEIIREIALQVVTWKNNWKNTTLALRPFMETFLIYDNRDIHEKPKTHILDFQQAREIMRFQLYVESENLKWALAEKLGVVVDSWYVPLVTASTGLLLEFEKE